MLTPAPVRCAAPADDSEQGRSLYAVVREEMAGLSARALGYADAGCVTAVEMGARVWAAVAEWLESVQVRASAGGRAVLAEWLGARCAPSWGEVGRKPAV